jgi:hypothetical protein
LCDARFQGLYDTEEKVRMWMKNAKMGKKLKMKRGRPFLG